MKFTTTDYGNRTEILKFPDHYVNVPVMVSDSGVDPDSDGKKIVKAGTIVGGAANPVLTNLDEPVVAKNEQGVSATEAEGVLFYDVDVTDVTNGVAPGAMIIHGFVDTTKLPEAPAADAVTALAGRIIFMK